MVSALGQCLGALATFLAVIVALNTAKQQLKINGKITINYVIPINLIDRKLLTEFSFISIKFINISPYTAHINSIFFVNSNNERLYILDNSFEASIDAFKSKEWAMDPNTFNVVSYEKITNKMDICASLDNGQEIKMRLNQREINYIFNKK